MKNPALYLLIPVLVLSASTCVLNSATTANAANSDRVILENGALTLTMKRTPTPHIVELVHKATGTALVTEPAEPALFAIVLAKDGGEDYVDSSTAKTTSLEVTRSERGSGVVITYYDFPNLDLFVSVRGTLSDGEPLTRWTIEVHNRTGRKINYVRFPVLHAIPGIGDTDDDFVVLPDLPGTLIRSPWRSWNVNDGVWLWYPGDLSAQFMAYQDASAGIYLDGRDASGFGKRLAIWKKEQGFWLCHDYFPSADAGTNWQSPYPVSIGVTQGSWRDSADIYKQWAVTQPWCAKTLAQRDDIPDWLRKGPLGYTSSMRTYDAKGNQTGSSYPRLLESLRYLKGKTDGQVVAMLADWENHRRWTAGDSFPVFDEKNAHKVITQISAEGFRPFFFLCGLFYTFENRGVNASKITIPPQYMSQFVTADATGKPQVFSVDESNASWQWQRDSYAFCVASPLVRQFFRSVIDQTSKLGVYVLQMDQTTSGAGFPCWSSQHGHVPGVGLYQAQDFHALLADMRSYGKGKNPDFALFNEEPHEELIPFVDGFHTRQYAEQWWYRNYPGAVGIPLFSYLYHEYAICYGGDSTHIGLARIPAVPWYVRQHAVNLVTGATPGAATWFYPEELSNADPRILVFIRNHRRLLDAGASRYLMEGRMLHPLEVEAPTLTYTGSVRNMPERGDFNEAAILTSSWQAGDGSVGHLFVNLAQTKLPLEVELDTRNAPSFTSCDVSACRSGSGGQFQPLWNGVTLPRRFSTVLAPDEIVFLELRAVKQ